jgi:protoporphyrinogen oxidase
MVWPGDMERLVNEDAVKPPVVIIGAGPAGLAASYALAGSGVKSLVSEKGAKVGGMARTEYHQGFRFDVGGHRYHTSMPDIQNFWIEVLGEELIKVSRLSRISYRERFFNYPLNLGNILVNLGIIESTRAVLSYLKARLRPYPEEENFEQWTVNRFGRRLFNTFFKEYTEKVWGIPCSQIQADWAAQRIQGLSLAALASYVLFGTPKARTLIDEFFYPILGSGQMWERVKEKLENHGNRIMLNSEVTGLYREGRRLYAAVIRKNGRVTEVRGEEFISTMPLPHLINRLDPPPPAPVREAADKLRHRGFILVGLILDRPDMFPDQWIYVHGPEVKVGRIQNFKNWSPLMVPDPNKTSLGMEYFCNEGDEIWRKSDEELINLAAWELKRVWKNGRYPLEGGMVIRQKHAYPLYNPGYKECLKIIHDYLSSIENFQTIGRNGLHRYDNLDLSICTGLEAARKILTRL